MDDPSIRITYDGGDADRNRIDMRLLGMSLEGADRITSDGILVFLHSRLPKGVSRVPACLQAKVSPCSATVNSLLCIKEI